MRRLPPLIATLLLTGLFLAACSRPEAPDKDRPVEPQAAVRHDDLKRAIDGPLQRAQGAQAAIDAAAASQDAAINAADAGHELPES